MTGMTENGIRYSLIVYDQDGREVMRHPRIGRESILWTIDRAIARGYYAIIDGDALALEAEAEG